MSELLNLVGLSTGVVLYAMLLVMVIRAGSRPGERPRYDPLLLATAVLGLLWNLCALPAYELPKVGIEGPFPFLIEGPVSHLEWHVADGSKLAPGRSTHEAHKKAVQMMLPTRFPEQLKERSTAATA